MPVNVERLPHFQRQNVNSEARAICSAIQEFLKSIEGEFTGYKRRIEDLVRLGVALGPHNCSLLPDEMLSRIFSLLALDHGTVKFPTNDKHPPQLVISRVCSHWRKVALGTPELWSDTFVHWMDDIDFYNRTHQWLFRARQCPVKLSIKLAGWLGGNKCAIALQNVLLPIPKIKRLSLCLSYKQFMEFSILAEAALSGLSELELDLTFREDEDMSTNTSNPHPLITRLQYVTFHGPNEELKAWLDPLRPSLPWNQLRSLNYEIYVQDPEHPIFGILRQMPLLEALSIWMHDIVVPEQLTMHSLRNLTLVLNMMMNNSSAMVDKMLRSFRCPYLAEFTLTTHGSWTCETLGILKQYNIQELRHAKIVGDFALPVSYFLRDAPMLRSLSLQRNAIIDEETVVGVSNGTLGRFLGSFDFTAHAHHDITGVLEMVKARKEMVDRLIENGCSWREEVTILKDVVVHPHTKGGTMEFQERVSALRKAGITFKMVS